MVWGKQQDSDMYRFRSKLLMVHVCTVVLLTVRSSELKNGCLQMDNENNILPISRVTHEYVMLPHKRGDRIMIIVYVIACRTKRRRR